MIIKILFTFLVLAINYILFRKFNNQTVKHNWVLSAFIFGLLVIGLNFIVKALPNQLPLFLIIFSFSTVILNTMKKSSSVIERSNLANTKQLQKIKDFVFNKVFYFLITIFQMLLIWSPALFQHMTNTRH